MALLKKSREIEKARHDDLRDIAREAASPEHIETTCASITGLIDVIIKTHSIALLTSTSAAKRHQTAIDQLYLVLHSEADRLDDLATPQIRKQNN